MSNRRARFRAFKCRLGVHRWFRPWNVRLYRVCADCKTHEVIQ